MWLHVGKILKSKVQVYEYLVCLQLCAELARSGVNQCCKPAEKQGNWIHCVAHGKHAEDSSLDDFLRLVDYFGIGRRSIGNIHR